MPLLFRPLGDAEWRDGITENISRSGVLFMAPGLMDVRTSVELGLVLASDPGLELRPQVLCRAEIVRAEWPDADEPRALLAARISEYHFVGDSGPEPRR